MEGNISRYNICRDETALSAIPNGVFFAAARQPIMRYTIEPASNSDKHAYIRAQPQPERDQYEHADGHAYLQTHDHLHFHCLPHSNTLPDAHSQSNALQYAYDLPDPHI